jgi:hypothetical protein
MFKTKETAIEFLALLSLANLGFVREWRLLLYAAETDAYYVSQYSALQYVVPIVLVVVIAALLTLFLHLGRRTKSPVPFFLFFSLFWILSLILTVSFLDWLKSTFSTISAAVMLNSLSNSPFLAISVGALALMLTYVLVRQFCIVVQIAKSLLLILSPYVLITFSQLAFLASRVEGEALLGANSHAGISDVPSGQARTKVVWIIFDELDQRVLFEDRPAHYTFPSFDQLRQQSLVASKVVQPGAGTITAIPALLGAQRVVDATPQSSDVLLVKHEEAGTFHPFEPDSTVFAKLARDGYRTTIAGYYHPYCRMFRSMYTTCRTYRHYGQRESDLVPVLRSYTKLLPILRRMSKIDAMPGFIEFINNQAIRSDIDLLYVHLPIPHAPFVYDAEAVSFTPFSFSLEGYFDDVVLADRILGDLRRELENAEQWETTHILISSDHAWRQSERFDGIKDTRVPYIVKLAGSSRPVDYDRPYDPLATTELIQALLRHEITVVEELEEWMVLIGSPNG